MIVAVHTLIHSDDATIVGEISDMGFGLTVMPEIPGADPIMLYESRHATASDL
jgi:hypothetical protein